MLLGMNTFQNIRQIGAKWNMEAKWHTGCLQKSMPAVGLFSRPLDFLQRPVQRHTSKSNLT